MMKLIKLKDLDLSAEMVDAASLSSSIVTNTLSCGVAQLGSGDASISYTAQDVSASAQNPFWDDDTGKVDFAKFAAKYGKTTIDYCYILLGWNSSTQPVESLKADIAKTISNIRMPFPNCQITLIGLPYPSQDGFGSNYRQYDAVDKSYSSLVKYVDTYQKIIDEMARTTENVYSLPIKQFFDTKHSYPTTATKVNLRSTEKTNMQNNCVHPSTVGYLQIADRVFVDFISKLQ